MLSFVVAALALSSGPATAPIAAPLPASASVAIAPSDAVGAALNFLELVDAARWDDSYRATGTEFQRLNTLATWQRVSETVRAPLGAVISRRLVSDDVVPSSQGYRLVKFRTDFAKKPGTLETVTLAREGGDWKITGITID